ncbi:uncharacterized protein LOC108913121 [Anoplophora glabripennis]|uniref:uncharacterized protein LOC108913121 n=1 Tax=Anoplophora glabripennis TaxID=217634 RepID=UPI0008747F9B|nr:uncharacterized protein LOC108913121 [Anoplophora glabripennis]
MHKECMIKWKTRVQQMKSCQGIDQDIERVIHSEKEKWRQILRIVMDAVLYLSTNCLSFRGSHETPSDLITQCPQPRQEQQKGTSIIFIKDKNEIIDILAKTVRNSILNDIKEAKYYTIMFDCTPDVSHTEQMSQVIRYVKRTGDVCEIKESFIDFIEVAGKTGEDICQQILEKLAVDDLDIGQYRGQYYDNGSNMAGIHKGVQARIAERNELAHFLNLVEGSSQTRWSAKHVAVNALLNNLPEIAEALEEVKQTSHAPEAKYERGVWGIVTFATVTEGTNVEVKYELSFTMIDGKVMELAKLGCDSVNDFIRRALKKLLSNKLASQVTICFLK